ncbi:unannotated protein [freshwater metagenome]|uniref:Unannotated protein n=1 Tax=freshwater metagenome TaxID=449393 RepID=A0A6J7V5D3_9ZZZZ
MDGSGGELIGWDITGVNWLAATKVSWVALGERGIYFSQVFARLFEEIFAE